MSHLKSFTLLEIQFSWANGTTANIYYQRSLSFPGKWEPRQNHQQKAIPGSPISRGRQLRLSCWDAILSQLKSRTRNPIPVTRNSIPIPILISIPYPINPTSLPLDPSNLSVISRYAQIHRDYVRLYRDFPPRQFQPGMRVAPPFGQFDLRDEWYMLRNPS